MFKAEDAEPKGLKMVKTLPLIAQVYPEKSPVTLSKEQALVATAVTVNSVGIVT